MRRELGILKSCCMASQIGTALCCAAHRRASAFGQTVQHWHACCIISCPCRESLLLAYAQAEEAEEEAQDMITVYAEFARNVAAMPVVMGRKSRLESFAGASRTYTIEAMMGDRRALQVKVSAQTRVICSASALWTHC